MTEICARLHHVGNAVERFRHPFEEDRIPPNGIYLLFETDEHAHGGDRIVRVGTHRGEDQLPSRLAEHYVRENKDRSIFRKNIGRAFLHRDRDPFLEQWNWDLTSLQARERYGPLLDEARRAVVEGLVTAHIQDRVSFVVMRVDDRERRSHLERRIIATVSSCDRCRPSGEWLGLHSPKPRIRESGLWQEHGLYKEPLSSQELAQLEQLARGGAPPG